ncbi:MAG: S-layer homology domain-containing protein [Clostridiales bacterium]|nr:S-layer homology domain-containing protein [Clostridiales bacterium]
MNQYQRIIGCRFVRIISLLLVMIIMSTTAGAVSVAQPEPYIATFSKTSEAGMDIPFRSVDFLSNIVGEGELEGIVLTSLPDESEGTLYCGNRALYAGEAVTTENLDQLYFKPAGSKETTTSFSFIPVFNNSNGQITTVSIAQVISKNNPPVAEDVEYETIKNIAVTCRFKISDPDGDDLVVRIQNPPTKGDVVISEEEPDVFIYTPYQNKTGTDSFTYVAVDPDGLMSNTAKVTIRITKNGAKMTYSDMEGNPAHFAAIKLAEEGILIGERMGNNYFFNPAKVVSRGEFVAMALTCLGIEVTTPVTKTGFADDSDTPAWVKPYLSTALKQGIITGVSTLDGRRVFRSENPLTRAEALVVLNNILKLDDGEKRPVFADDEAVPAWAMDAASKAVANDLIETASDGSLRPMDNVTRADAAEMLYRAMKIKESEKSRSLLSRIFG